MGRSVAVSRMYRLNGVRPGPGSYEYVAFWIDFGDGDGLTYIGTSSVQVYDFAKIPAEGLQYAVRLKTDLGQRIAPCTTGPRVVHLRAILSWASAPPAGNPSFVPVWGNRTDCLVQLRPGGIAGHVPVIDTVGNVGVDDIDSIGLATGPGVGAAFQALQSPFGGAVQITGRIGDPPDTFGGSGAKFRYRVEVKQVSPIVTDWQPLTNTITVKVSEALDGVPLFCAPGKTVCDVTLTPSDDLDGFGGGWYDYLQDYKGAYTRFLVEDELASWWTSAQMEGLWKIRITTKDMATTPPTVHAGIQEVTVQIDNTPATCDLAITSATFGGKPLPSAADCGQFPVGTILGGTYSASDPGTVTAPSVPPPAQHFGSWSLVVLPSGATPSPSSGAFPIVPTIGESGTWTLDTTGMPACGYVLYLAACDRTVYDSGFVGLCTEKSKGFCLVDPAAAK